MFTGKLKSIFESTKKYIKTHTFLKKPKILTTNSTEKFKNPYILQETVKLLNNILQLTSVKKEIGMSIKLSFTQNLQNSNYSSLFQDNRLLIMVNAFSITESMMKELRLKKSYKTIYLSQKNFVHFSKIIFAVFKFTKSVSFYEEKTTIDLSNGNLTCEVEVDEFEKDLCSVCLKTQFWTEIEEQEGKEEDQVVQNVSLPFFNPEEVKGEGDEGSEKDHTLAESQLDEYSDTDSEEEYSKVEIEDLPNLDDEEEEVLFNARKRSNCLTKEKHRKYLVKSCKKEVHVMCQKCRDLLFGKFSPKFCPECLFDCKAKNMAVKDDLGDEDGGFKVISRNSDLYQLKIKWLDEFHGFIKSYTNEDEFVMV